jgi:hypothetical protein
MVGKAAVGPRDAAIEAAREAARMSDAEYAELVTELRGLSSMRATDDAEEVAAAIAGGVESIRLTRLTSRLPPPPGDRTRYEVLRGRPDALRHLRFALIKAAFGPWPGPQRGEPTRRHMRPTLTQRDGNKPGSDFEEAIAIAYRLAGLRIASVHRDCLAAVREFWDDRA